MYTLVVKLQKELFSCNSPGQLNYGFKSWQVTGALAAEIGERKYYALFEARGGIDRGTSARKLIKSINSHATFKTRTMSKWNKSNF